MKGGRPGGMGAWAMLERPQKKGATLRPEPK